MGVTLALRCSVQGKVDNHGKALCNGYGIWQKVDVIANQVLIRRYMS